MNEKEIAEIRRRLTPEKSSITRIYGCYVNEKREIISMFSQSLGIIPEEEAKAYLTLFKRCLSGTLGRNLLDVAFSVRQVMDSAEEHRRLMALRSSALQDEALIEEFFAAAVAGIELEGNFLVLLAHDVYDVPLRGKDGGIDRDGSSRTFPYILCAVCPVKQIKPALSYRSDTNEFHRRDMDWVVSAPELGFMFPAFDDRRANIHNALYYTKNTSESQDAFLEALFRTDMPRPADRQMESFRGILADSLAEECDYRLVQTVHDRISERIEIHKEAREEEPLTVSAGEVRRIFEECGVSEKHANDFGERFREEFGEDARLSPHNLIDRRQFELRTPDVVIRVNPERSDLIETRIINGMKYILISADEGVEVNGVSISINE